MAAVHGNLRSSSLLSSVQECISQGISHPTVPSPPSSATSFSLQVSRFKFSPPLQTPRCPKILYSSANSLAYCVTVSQFPYAISPAFFTSSSLLSSPSSWSCTLSAIPIVASAALGIIENDSNTYVSATDGDLLEGELESTLGNSLESSLENSVEEELRAVWEDFRWQLVNHEQVSAIFEKVDLTYPKKLHVRAVGNITNLVAIGLSQEEVLKALKNQPALLNYSPEDMKVKILEKAIYFANLGVKQSEYCKGLSRGARFVSAPAQQIEAVVSFLVEEIGIERLGKMVKEAPTLFGTPVAAMQSKVEFLRSVGIHNVSKCVDRNPQCLQLSSESMRVKISTLQTIIGDEYPVVNIIEKMPKLLSRKAETVKDSFSELVKAFGRETMQRTVIKAPQVLFVSKSNVVRVLNFVENVMQRDREEVLRAPAVLTYSVDKRLMPRYKACVDAGKGHLSISRMFVLAPSQFDVSFGTSLYRNSDSTLQGDDF